VRKQAGALSFIGSFFTELPEFELPEIAFAGRSNVGKSSALNCLLRRKKAARVSSTPGRTQAINLFKVGTACIFADLPGYGFAKVPDDVQENWKHMIEEYLAKRKRLKLVVVLVDARRDPQTLDGQLVASLQEAEIPVLVVATKTDKLKKSHQGRQLSQIRKEFNLPYNQPVPFSAVTGAGRDGVWDLLEKACR